MALPELFANSPTPGSVVALTTLGAAITTTGATSITTNAAAPTALQAPGQFRIVIDSEIMIVTAGASGTTWTVTRGAEPEGPAATHLNGAGIFHYLTAGALQAVTTETVHTVATSGAAQTINLSLGNIWDITLTAACAITLPTAVAGRSFVLILRQDGTGSRLATWPSSAYWPSGVYPTLSTATSSVDVISFECEDGTNWLAFPAGYGMGTGGNSPSIPAVVQTALTAEQTTARAAEALGASDPLTPTGVTYQNFSRFANQTVTGALASGQMKVSAIWLPTGFTVTSISFLSSTALVLGTSPHFWFALFDSSGNLLRQTADQTAAAWAATTLKTVNLSSTFVTTYTGLHYLGVMVAQTGGTFPTLVAANVSTGAVSLAPILGGSGGDSGLTTTAPNPMAAINTGTNVVYCGVA